ncbi:MAG: glucose-6-phosphate isomerase [Pikeienuella sp.]
MDTETAREAAWQAVRHHADRLAGHHLRRIADDPSWPDNTWRAGPLTLVCRLEKIDGPAWAGLISLARAAGLEAARQALFDGADVNLTERRPALHMALRGSCAAPPGCDVAAARERLLSFAEAVRSGAHPAAGGPVCDVVNIGIGGSDLGPAMAAAALRPDCDGPRLHFVSNVDGAHLADTLADLDPARTLIVIASKSFTTQETMLNARSARDWLEAALDPDTAARQMAAVSTNIAGCAAFGIPEARVFGFWDWVGGRYSIWSSVGLSLAIGIGARDFEAFLAGAAEIDANFRDVALDGNNLALRFGLIGVWRRLCGAGSVALLPYDQRLARFPAYVQQLEMESNGKRVTATGRPVSGATAPVIWGEPGTNAQHSFFQLLHQGTDPIPVDFILARAPRGLASAQPQHHAALAANCVAQAQALARGRTEAEARAFMAEQGATPEEIDLLAAHRVFPGDRPSTTLLLDQLDPRSLGALIALFEHRVFVQAVVWGINPFDQWGVELGKELAKELLPVFSGSDEPSPSLDPATALLVAKITGRTSSA